MIENIISGIIGGLVVLLCQLAIEYYKKKKDEIKKLRVGNPDLLILNKDFLYKYEPQKYSFEKIVSEFGQPFKKYKNSYENWNVELFQYNFQNAKVLFSKAIDSSELVSVTLFSMEDKNNPVLCRLSFEDEEVEMGRAFINDTIVRDGVGFENYPSSFGMTCIVQSRYYYRQIKHLTFSYQIDGNFETLEETKGKLITQVCISQNNAVTPMLSSNDTFYV